MDKESIFELQKIDCNCNDCLFMVRDSEKLNRSLEFHKQIQLDEFEREKQRLLDLSNYYQREENELEISEMLYQEQKKMRFQFDKKEIRITYGDCSKLNKPVSFIQGTCQIDTQNCFHHRRENNEN